jgi:hypothetical protein
MRDSFLVQQLGKEYLLVPSVKTHVTGAELEEGRPLRLFAAPNPTAASSALHFGLAVASRVSVDVIDIGGRRVRWLAREQLFGAGRHTLVWDGRSTNGVHLSPGLYFVRLRNGARVEVVRVVLER